MGHAGTARPVWHLHSIAVNDSSVLAKQLNGNSTQLCYFNTKSGNWNNPLNSILKKALIYQPKRKSDSANFLLKPLVLHRSLQGYWTFTSFRARIYCREHCHHLVNGGFQASLVISHRSIDEIVKAVPQIGHKASVIRFLPSTRSRDSWSWLGWRLLWFRFNLAFLDLHRC